jgi:hypothetical protein
MSRLSGPAAIAILGLALASPAGVAAQQTQPLPQDLARQLPARQRTAGLELDASVGGGYDTNPDYRTSQGSATAFGDLRLDKTWVAQKLTVGLGGFARGSLYQSDAAQSRFDFGGTLGLSGTLGERTKASLSTSAELTHNDQLFDATTSAVLLPVMRTRVLTAGADLTHELGSRTQLGLRGSFASLHFDQTDPLLITGAQVQDGNDITANARLSHGFSPRQQLSAFYSFQSNNYQVSRRAQVHTLGAGYTIAVGQRSRLGLDAGADAYSRAGAGGASKSLYFEGTYTWTGRRSTFVTALRRGVAPGPGLGQDRVLAQGSASWSVTLPPRFALAITGTHAQNERDTATAVYRFPTDEASAALSARLSRMFNLSLVNEYRRRGAIADQPQLDSYRVALTLDFQKAFR